MKTFEKPLSKEKESYYVHLLSKGTAEEQKIAKEILISRNLRLVAHIVKKYQNTGEDTEDLLSIGSVGLIKAINTFEESKGALATYACRCIDNELLMFFRSKKKLAKEVSLYEPIGQDKEGNEIYLMDVVSKSQQDVENLLENSENIYRLRKAMGEVLNEKEREILVLRYGLYGVKEHTQSEVGKRFGISRSYVSRLEKKAIKKLAVFLK